MPEHGFRGVATFSFRVYEEGTDLESWPATVTIQVGPPVETRKYQGIGTTVVTSTTQYQTIECESEADWTINLGADGKLWGRYDHKTPSVPDLWLRACRAYNEYNDLGTDDWVFDFSGSWSNDKFEISSVGIFYYTHRYFIYPDTNITGGYDDSQIYALPDYVYEKDGYKIEYRFSLGRKP